MKKIIILTTILLLIAACKQNNQKNTSDDTQVSTMADIAQQIQYYDDSEDIEPISAYNETQNNVITTPATPTTPTQNTQSTQTMPHREPEQGDFTVQFMSSKDREKVEDVRRKLDNAAYYAETIPIEINGEIWYRLRLRGAFSRSYADYLAQQIKNQIPEITEYWVTTR